MFRCFSDPVCGNDGLWWTASVLHGIGTGTVSSQRLFDSMETDLPGTQRYKSITKP